MIKQVIPKIVEMFEDSDENVRISALRTCSAIAQIQQGQNKMEAGFFAQSVFVQLPNSKTQ
jgi:hypothetical protein